MNTAEQPQLQDTPTAEPEQSVGQMLVAARQAQSLSVTDVANRLKLSVQQVEALEQGAYDRLPGPVFVRGFTRNYARLLKLDPEAAVRAVDALLPRAPAEQGAGSGEANIPMPGKSTGRWPVLAGIAAVVFLSAALIDVLWPETPPTTAVAPANPGAPHEGVAPATPSEPTVEAADAGVSPPAQVPAIAEAPSIAPAPAALPASGTGAVPATYQPNTGSGARTVRLVFDQQSWVQVRDASGKVVLEALYPPGSSRELTAQPPLTLIIGNAPGVRVTYADRAVDLTPHTRVAVARLTLE